MKDETWEKWNDKTWIEEKKTTIYRSQYGFNRKLGRQGLTAPLQKKFADRQPDHRFQDALFKNKAAQVIKCQWKPLNWKKI